MKSNYSLTLSNKYCSLKNNEKHIFVMKNTYNYHHFMKNTYNSFCICESFTSVARGYRADNRDLPKFIYLLQNKPVNQLKLLPPASRLLLIHNRDRTKIDPISRVRIVVVDINRQIDKCIPAVGAENRCRSTNI